MDNEKETETQLDYDITNNNVEVLEKALDTVGDAFTNKIGYNIWDNIVKGV